MIEDSRFWIFCIILFLSAYLSSEILGRLFKRHGRLRFLYIAGALASSVGLWLSASRPLPFLPDVLHLSNGIAIGLGVLIGVHPFFLALPLIAPIFLTFMLNYPLQSFLPEKEPDLGVLSFLPSEGDRLSMVWDDGEKESLINLNGDQAALIVMSCESRPAFFFLKDMHLVLGVATEPLLSGEFTGVEEGKSHIFQSHPEWADRYYDIHYPAPRFVDPDYFGAWSYKIQNGGLKLERR